MERLMNPTKAEELPTYQPPAMSEASQAGFWEKLLGPLSLGLNTASALRPGAPQASPSARAFSPADTQFRA